MEKRAKNVSDAGEFGLIGLLRRQLHRYNKVIVGIGDDTAVLPYDRQHYLLFTTDLIAEGVHFFPSEDPLGVGYKALGCNISDIAAMGGKPTYAVVSLALPAKTKISYVRALYKGIEKVGKKFSVSIVGGDTVRANKVSVNIALLGLVKKNEYVLRSGARPGDTIFVSGALGRSLATGKHLSFVPRVAEAQLLVKRFKPTAMIDISDGLTADLGHILEESRVGAVLFEELIPRNKGTTLSNALYDGEDFELLFTLSPSDVRRARTRGSRFPFYPIGKIVPGKGARLVGQNGKVRPLLLRGYTHF